MPIVAMNVSDLNCLLRELMVLIHATSRIYLPETQLERMVPPAEQDSCRRYVL